MPFGLPDIDPDALRALQDLDIPYDLPDDDSEEAKKKRALNIQPWMQQARLRPDDSLWGYNWSGDYGNFYKQDDGQYVWQSDEEAGDSPRVWDDWEFYDDQPPLPDELAPDEPDPWQPIPDLDKGWDSFLSNAQRMHDQGAARDAASRTKYNSELAAAKRQLAAAETDDDKKAAKQAISNAEFGIDFLNKYQVYKGGNPLVEGYGEQQWKDEALKGDWSDFYQPVKEPIGDTTGEVDISPEKEAETDQSPIDYDLGGRAGAKQRIDRIKEIESLQDNLARETKQQRLAQETGTAIRQLETDQRSSEPTLAERLGGRAGAKQRSEGKETTDLLTNILDWQGFDNKGATLREKIAPIGDVLGMIPEGLNALENVAVGAIPLIKSFKHTAGWTQGTDENPARIHHTPSASRTARDRANEYINSLGEEAIKKIREDGRLSTDQLSELTTAIQPNQTGTEWNYTMNSLANPRIDLEDNPRQEGQVQVKRLFDNFQFDSERDVSFDLPGKPIQGAVELFQNQNIKNDPLRATYELDQSDPGNTRNTRRMPVFTEFDYTWDNIKHGLTPKGPNRGRSGARNNRAMSGKSIGNVGGRKLFKLPSISNNILAN